MKTRYAIGTPMKIRHAEQIALRCASMLDGAIARCRRADACRACRYARVARYAATR